MNYQANLSKLVEEIKAQGYKSVCMWQPAYNLGGGSAYLRFAKYLVEHTDLTVYYMDYKDGYLSYLLNAQPCIHFLHYDENLLDFPVKEKCIIIVNSTRVVQMPRMNPENKLVFWHWETIPSAWDIVLINHEVKKYLELTKNNHAMIYHDWSARDSLNRYQHIGFENKDYLMLTLPPKTVECRKELVEADAINICFLSRLANDKKRSLFYLIDNYAKYKTNKKKKLHIIGDGVAANEVKNFCKKFEKEIEFIFNGTVPKERLDDYLINHADILFGVGTSVLEGASLKIPSVVLLMDSRPIHDEDAFWVYDTKEYCMGILTEEKADFGVKYTKISEIIDSVYNKSNGKKDEGQKSYEYFIENHSSMEQVIYSLLTFFKESTLTFKKLQKCIKYTPYCQLSIVKIKLLGINAIKIMQHVNTVRIYMGPLQIYKKVADRNKTKHYVFGINIMTTRRITGWKPLATSFKDTKRG